MLSKGINDSLVDSVYKKIDNLITRYVGDGVSLYDLKRYYKNKNNIKALISDIQNEGERMFTIDGEYYEFVIGVIKDVFDDRLSEFETEKMSENKLHGFSSFINEKKNNTNDE